MSECRGFLQKKGDVRLVGASNKASDYEGPVARVFYDETWLYIVTDDNEGRAMLNIEALPYLRRALNQITKERAEADCKTL